MYFPRSCTTMRSTSNLKQAKLARFFSVTIAYSKYDSFYVLGLNWLTWIAFHSSMFRMHRSAHCFKVSQIICRMNSEIWQCCNRKLERHAREASHCGSMQQKRSCAAILLLLLARATCNGVILHAHPVRGESHNQRRRGCNNTPSFLQRTTPIARSLCESWTRYDLHILVTAPFCCNPKPDQHVRKASHRGSKQQ